MRNSSPAFVDPAAPLGAVDREAAPGTAAVHIDPAQVYDLHRIARRYDLKKMRGPDAVRLASELVRVGFEESDALAVTLPITSRNLLSRMGRVARAPRIESWTDLMMHHVAQFAGARSSKDAKRLDQLARLVVLAQVLAEADDAEAA